MTKKPRIKTPIFSARANGQVIRRGQATVSTHSRIQSILRELGGDAQQVLRDIRWQRVCRPL